jgi:predicted alpha-1,2-mannosidase
MATIEVQRLRMLPITSEKLMPAKKHLFAALAVPVLVSCLLQPALAREPVDDVDTIIGAKSEGGNLGGGKTFPGACVPFGMVQLSPDTITGGDNGAGYSYYGQTIEGFSFAHLSGVGAYGDLGNLQVMPMTGPLRFRSGSNALDLYRGESDGWKSPYGHSNEVTAAGYYAVTLERYGIRAEMTAATHAGLLQFTYPTNATPRLQIDLARRIGGRARTEFARVLDDRTIEGWMRYEGDGRGFAAKTRYTFHFHAEFDQPMRTHGFWNLGQDLGGLKEREGDDLGFYATFEPGTRVVRMKAGISFVSVENAKENLQSELPGFDFDRTRRDARALWAQALSKIQIEGGTETERKIFYTALYRTMIDPRTFTDVNGEFFGADKQTHRATNYTQRTIFSGWDVFRSQFPLQTILNPAMVNDEIISLMHVAEFGPGRILPRWELLNTEAGTMLGNPAVSVIADAWTKGIRHYDGGKAYRYALATVTRNSNGEPGYSPGQLSKTLEYAYSDWCFARLAEAMGKPDVARQFDAKSQSYTNIWNNDVHWFRARNADGTWTEWKGRDVYGQGCVESDPYQQGWFVPQDVPGLIRLMGGDAKFIQELDDFFERTPKDFRWNNYYNHPNEPCHHIAFLYPYAGAPWLTQEWSRRICEHAYGLGPEGLCGNEDVGQMSAWYVLAASGFHPVCPGDGIYIITSPVFDKITFRLDPQYASGKTFSIVAHGNSPTNLYIQSARLNGRPINRAWLRHQEIADGGTLDLTMGPAPNQAWGQAENQRPQAATTEFRTAAEQR